jgi:hypothetical protein
LHWKIHITKKALKSVSKWLTFLTKQNGIINWESFCHQDILMLVFPIEKKNNVSIMHNDENEYNMPRTDHLQATTKIEFGSNDGSCMHK